MGGPRDIRFQTPIPIRDGDTWQAYPPSHFLSAADPAGGEPVILIRRTNEWMFDYCHAAYERIRIRREPRPTPGMFGLSDEATMRDNRSWMHVDFTFSKQMGRAYWANVCPDCGAIQGDNFVFNNYKGRGGGFSNANYTRYPAEWLTLPPFADLTRRDYAPLLGRSACGIDPTRIRTLTNRQWADTWQWGDGAAIFNTNA